MGVGVTWGRAEAGVQVLGAVGAGQAVPCRPRPQEVGGARGRASVLLSAQARISPQWSVLADSGLPGAAARRRAVGPRAVRAVVRAGGPRVRRGA